MVESNALLELMKKRRSIRKFKAEPIDKALINKVLEAGLWAPSGKNLQNWRYFVVTGKKRDEYLKHSQKSWLNIQPILQKKLKPSLYEFTERFFYTLGDAPVLIFCYTKNDPEEKKQTSTGSVYMAVENMTLMAVSLGLGTCVMGAPLEIKEDVNNYIGKEKVEGLELLCGIVLGWPDHNPPAAPRQTEGRITWIE